MQQEADERNYHIFYQLLAGADKAMGSTLRLLGASEYKFLSMSGCVSVAGVNDVDTFAETVTSMDIVGISKAEQLSVFRIVSAVLRLGNIEFVSPNGNEDASSVSDVGRVHLDIVAELIGVDSLRLTQVLTERLVAAGRGSANQDSVECLPSGKVAQCVCKVVI